MKEFTIENLDTALQHKNIIVNQVAKENNDGDFNRIRFFTIKKSPVLLYKIEWWKNICYLSACNLKIPFDSVKQSGTWPNRYKLNLQFSYNNKTCCILPIESY